MIKAIKNLIPMRDTQAKRRVSNSPAIPLPSASFGPQIPLPETSANDTQATDSAQVLTSDRAHFGDQSAFCPWCQGGSGWGEASARRPLRRLDQDIDAAGGEGQLAPGLVVDQPRRIDDDGQHAVGRSTPALPLGPHRAAAAQRTRQHLADKGERVALV